jgi:hypothetical protein
VTFSCIGFSEVRVAPVRWWGAHKRWIGAMSCLRELLLPRESRCVPQKEEVITVLAPMPPLPLREPPSKVLGVLPS